MRYEIRHDDEVFDTKAGRYVFLADDEAHARAVCDALNRIEAEQTISAAGHEATRRANSDSDGNTSGIDTDAR